MARIPTENDLQSRGWPPVLAHAAFESFTFIVKLTTGEMFASNKARDLGGSFVELSNPIHVDAQWMECHCGILEPDWTSSKVKHGLQLRVSQIVWVFDGRA